MGWLAGSGNAECHDFSASCCKEVDAIVMDLNVTRGSGQRVLGRLRYRDIRREAGRHNEHMSSVSAESDYMYYKESIK